MPHKKYSKEDHIKSGLKRFRDSITITETCWIWNKSKNTCGYGNFFFDGKVQKAHRVSLMLFSGPIPKGMYVDHKCRVRACVNPNHLRVVTPTVSSTENCFSPPAINKRKTHCQNGHPLELVVSASGIGRRRCLICISEYGKRKYWANKSAKIAESKELDDPESFERECGSSGV